MEYIKKCNVCGNIWCYTDKDIKDNATNSFVGLMSAFGSIANTIGGTRYNAYEQNKMADRALNKVTDYDKCPHCNSSDTVLITKEKYEEIKKIEEKKKNGFFTNASPEALIKRIKMFIEERDWISAKLYLEQVVEMTPDDPVVYLLSLYVDNKVINDKELIEKCIINNNILNENKNFKYIKKFGNETNIKEIEEINEKILKGINEQQQIENEKLYDKAINIINNSMVVEELENARNILLNLGEYKNTKEKIKIIDEKIKEIDYAKAINIINNSIIIKELENAKEILLKLGEYKDTKEKTKVIDEKIQKIEREIEIEKQKSINKLKKKLIIISIFIVIGIIISIIFFTIKKKNLYNEAIALYEREKYNEAIEILENLENYKDSKEQLNKVANKQIEENYNSVKQLIKNQEYEKALNILETIKNNKYNDSQELIEECELFEDIIKFITEKANSDYVKLNLKKYRQLSGEEIKDIIVGEWKNTNGKIQRYFENGNFDRGNPTDESVKSITWGISSNRLYVTTQYSRLSESSYYLVYHIKDNYYLLRSVAHDFNGKIDYENLESDIFYIKWKIS